MAPKFSFILLLLAFAALVVDSSIIRDSHFDIASFTGGVRGSGGLPTCNGLVGECIDNDEEMMLDSDSARRSLAQRGRFISYAAMRKNSVPCPRRGQSYYQCGSATKVNPYRRGCSKMTRCYRNLG